MSTSECSCRLWPTPGIYVVTSIPLVRRTRATLRSAEFGFFGVCVKTRTQTPRFCGLFCSAALLVFVRTFSRPLRTSWLIVGTGTPSKKNDHREKGGSPLLRGLVAIGLGRRDRGPAPGTGLPYSVYVLRPCGHVEAHRLWPMAAC